MVIAVDDEVPMRLIRLFNEPEGRDFLVSQGVDPQVVERLDLLGISSVGNTIAAIKFAKYYELTEEDVVLTMATDSMEMYASRLKEMEAAHGPLDLAGSAMSWGMLQATGMDTMEELTYYGRKRLHNLKYYTWVEQQGKTFDEIQAQWYDPDYWTSIPALAPAIDRQIEEFNRRTGLLAALEANS
jgi:hypothetical protein